MVFLSTLKQNIHEKRKLLYDMTLVEFPRIIERGRGLDVLRDSVVASILSNELIEEM